MVLHESAENYLKTIYRLSKTLPVVRSVDIATEMGFTKPSVSVAMKHLRENHYIEVSKAGFITLTESGREIAEMIYNRHEFLSHWLIRLGISPEMASTDACRMEHILHKETFQAIKDFIEQSGYGNDSEA